MPLVLVVDLKTTISWTSWSNTSVTVNEPKLSSASLASAFAYHLRTKRTSVVYELWGSWDLSSLFSILLRFFSFTCSCALPSEAIKHISSKFLVGLNTFQYPRFSFRVPLLLSYCLSTIPTTEAHNVSSCWSFFNTSLCSIQAVPAGSKQSLWKTPKPNIVFNRHDKMWVILLINHSFLISFRWLASVYFVSSFIILITAYFLSPTVPL